MLRIGRLSSPIALLLIAACVRLIRLENNPYWFSDEGTHLDIASHLANGEVRYLALGDSTLLFAKLPLFEQLVALALRLLPSSMLTLRLVTVGCSLLSIALLYWLVRASADDRLALLAAALLALLPEPILYSRFGFSYNLLTPLLLLLLWALLRFDQTQDNRWLLLAGTTVGLALTTDVWALTLFPPLALAIGLRHWKRSIYLLPGLLLPLLIWVGSELLRAPDAFWFDLNYTFGRIANKSTLTSQLQTLQTNISMLGRSVGWLPLSVLGLFLIPQRRLRTLALLFSVLPFLALGRTLPLFQLSFYYMIPLLPLLALGLASSIERALHYAARYDTAHTIARVLVIGWFISVGTTSLRYALTHFPNDIQPFLVNGEDAKTIVNAVNEQLAPDDVVLASPAIAWLIDGRAADFQFQAAWHGFGTPHLPGNIPRNRWLFNPDFSEAAIVIVDPLWTEWAHVHVPQTDVVLDTLESWPILTRSGTLRAHCNPSWPACFAGVVHK